MLKILQARLQQFISQEPQKYKLSFWRGRGTRDQIANMHWIMEKKKGVAEEHLLHWLKPLTVWITAHCGEFIKKWEYQTTLPVHWAACMWVKKHHWESNMEQLTGSKLGKGCIKAVYCLHAYLTSMHRVQRVKCQSGWIASWNQDCQQKYQHPQICRWYHPNDRTWERVKRS